MNLQKYHQIKNHQIKEKIMKKSMAVAVAFAMMTGALAGCAGSSSGVEEESTKAKVQEPEYQGKLDLINPTAYNNVYGLDLEKGTYLSIIGKRSDDAYWKEIQKGIKQAVADINAELGYEGSDKVKATFNAPAKADDVDQQVNILDEELSRYPEAVAISVADIKACEVQFDLATENNIPIVTYDSGTDYDGVMASVATDNQAAGKEVADKMGEALEKTGEVLVFSHDSKSQAAIDRTLSFIDEIKAAYPEVSIVETYAMDRLDLYKEKVAEEINAGTYDLETKTYTGDGSNTDAWTTESSDSSKTTVASTSESTSNAADASNTAGVTASNTAGATGSTATSSTDGTAVSPTDGTATDASAQGTEEAPKIQASDITEENVIDYIFAKHPNAKGIYATNSEVMNLVLSGLDRNEIDTENLVTMGFDVNDKVKTALEEGTIDGVVLQNPFGMGYASVIAAARAALDMANEAVVNTGYTWVTKDNYKEDAIQAVMY